jgi:hypothetical protein
MYIDGLKPPEQPPAKTKVRNFQGNEHANLPRCEPKLLTWLALKIEIDYREKNDAGPADPPLTSRR